jgi:hypothetical protein
MKRAILFSFLLMIFLSNLSGQWYYKKYGAGTINHLTQKQLNESLVKANDFTIDSWGVAAVGGALILYGKYVLHTKVADDATVLEQLLGSRFIGRVSIVAGTGMFAGGAACGVAGLGRMASIKTAIKINNYTPGVITLSPALIINNNLHPVSPGVEIKISF